MARRNQQGRKVRLYRMILRALSPLLALQVLGQRLRGRAGAGALAERFALGAAGRAEIWLHGASNGELASARWLIERLQSLRPDLTTVVTCNTWTAREMVAGWGLPRLSVRLAPFDTPGAVRRFRRGWNVSTLIFLENELWPERIAQMAAQGQVVAIGARMSEGSARNWARIAPGLIGAMLRGLALVSAQDAGSEQRLLRLGLPADRLGPRLMLKAQTAAETPAAPPFPAPAPRGRILLAASTHEGEEAVVLRGFAAARAAGSLDLLILAPRHPRRSAEVAALVAASGLPFATRSKGETPGPDTAVYLADTLGEMPLWYAMAGVTLVCGSFGTAGGHTPYEPAAQGSAILHGPGLANFTEVYALLDAAGAALPVTAETLGAALSHLTPARQAALTEVATRLLATPDAGAEVLIAALLPLLPPPQPRG